MDKKTILAFLLIGLVLIVTQTKFYRDLIFPKQPQPELTARQDSVAAARDTFKVAPAKQLAEKKKEQGLGMVAESAPKSNEFAALFQNLVAANDMKVSIETPNYSAEIDPNGAVISSWRLKHFKYDDREPVQLVKNNGYGNLGVFFVNNQDTIDTFSLPFVPSKQMINFKNGEKKDSLRMTLDLGNDKQMIKTFTFYRDEYLIELKLEIKNLVDQFDNHQYYITWKSGLAYTEVDYLKNIEQEDINNSKAYVFLGGSKEDLNLPNKPFEKRSRADFSGLVDWAAIRTKYFAMIILPEKDQQIEPILAGQTSPIYKSDNLKSRVEKTYSVTLKSIIPPTNTMFVQQRLRIYFGPLDYFIIKNYHPTLSKLMDFGGSIISPFAQLVLRAFIFLHSFIPNYGLVLIVFALIIKFLTNPLTKKSMVSMQRMQALQPKLNELKEKYGKDPQRMNKETMKLYKEAGVNPLGGCLPTLLQLPLLWAIFIVFRNTIELRDAKFFWWIKDLSAPDTILQLPVSIPLYGNLINVLPLIMGITMFLQQKMTMKDPKQKAMVYFMPIFLTLLFNSFPSGLNLYYTLFNVFSMVQQKWFPVKDSLNEDVKPKKLNYSQKLQRKFLLSRKRFNG
ncbi:MAG: membrane protein insertase YidC [candidate division KSB1 bacterium]|nr:membrane protein insertase YidC [candidate division KSB1 bacterium]MDZ7340960.1 membrane protein insertase YidC [candidate division KSB1 bacterium]